MVRLLGPEYFGLLAFAAAFITYFVLLTDYGFNLSATRQVSIYRDDNNKISEIFSAVMIIKAFLALAGFVFMVVIVFSFEKFSRHWELYVVTYGLVVGQMLFPVWLFQGMERMKYITYLNISAKVFFTVCIFSFVKEQEDYLLVPLLTAMGFIVSGVLSLYVVAKKFDVVFSWQDASVLKSQLAEGWHVFLSSMSISLYTVSTTFILGLFVNNTVVGYFAAADKIVHAVKGLYVPVSQAIYPLVGKKLYEDKEQGLVFIKKVSWVVGAGMFVISGMLFILADPIVVILLGEQYQESIFLLKVMAFLPFIVALGNIFGIQTMLNLGYKKEFSLFIFVAAIAGLLLSLYLTSLYEAVGTSFAVLIVEVFIAVMLGLFVRIKIRNRTL